MINKDEIYKLVEIFYQPKFKIFYVNSDDGVNFISPKGVFISLGITTSVDTLVRIQRILNESYGYDTKLAELRSTQVGGQYINNITDRPSSDIDQYVSTDYPETILTELEAKEELDILRAKMNADASIDLIREVAPKVSQLSDVIQRLDDIGWNGHLVQVLSDGSYKIFHTKVNYFKNNGSEYRIGIFVTEK